MNKNFWQISILVLAVLLLAASSITNEQWSQIAKNRLFTFFINPRVAVKKAELDPQTKIFVETVQYRIEEKWKPLLASEVKRAVVFFYVRKDGTTRGAQLMQKSGDSSFDRAALKAVEDASGTITRYPQSLGNEVEFEMTFDLNDYKRKR